MNLKKHNFFSGFYPIVFTVILRIPFISCCMVIHCFPIVLGGLSNCIELISMPLLVWLTSSFVFVQLVETHENK